MKSKMYVINILSIAVSIAMIVGLLTIFAPCEHADKVMKCNYSTRMIVLLLSVQTIVILMQMIAKGINDCGRVCLTMVNICIYFAIVLVARVLVGGCGDLSMRCNSVTFPAVYIGVMVGILLQGLFLIALHKGKADA